MKNIDGLKLAEYLFVISIVGNITLCLIGIVLLVLE